MVNLKLEVKDIKKIINSSKQASKNLENYDKGSYQVDIKKINNNINSVIGRKLDV